MGYIKLHKNEVCKFARYTITNNNLSRIEENNKTPYQGACLNLIYKFDFGKKVKVKRAKSIQTTSDSYLRK